MQRDKKKDVLCMAFLRRRNCSVADRCSMVFVRKNRWNLQSSQIDLVIVGTFSVCSVISCSFFCIYIDVELFALKDNQLVGATLAELGKHIKPGVTTLQLDKVAV